MSDCTRLPDFLCLGAPKCGSSWLHELLNSHPQVFIPTELKEIHFFDEKFDKGFDWYARFFQSASPDHLCVGEITPHYIYADPKRVKRCESVKKFILIYRDPIERCISHYKFRMRLDNYNQDFESFLNDYPQAIEWSMYGKYLGKYLEEFDRSQFLVLRYEDATENVPATKHRLAKFLCLDASCFPESAGHSKVNASFQPRHKKLYKLATQTAKWMGDSGLYRLRNWLKSNSLVKRFLMNDSNKFNVRISDAMRHQLQAKFEKDQERLQSLVGKVEAN